VIALGRGFGARAIHVPPEPVAVLRGIVPSSWLLADLPTCNFYLAHVLIGEPVPPNQVGDRLSPERARMGQVSRVRLFARTGN
jgi:hypothetical protein